MPAYISINTYTICYLYETLRGRARRRATHPEPATRPRPCLNLFIIIYMKIYTYIYTQVVYHWVNPCRIQNERLVFVLI